MTYVINVPFEVTGQLSLADPDVRSIRRLPGFVRLEQVDRESSRYELTIEVEAGSRRDAIDAAEELIIEYHSALGAYDPRLLASLAPELK
jgi:hypothetical protein